MPETPVDKDGDPSAGEDDVRSKSTHLASKPITQTLRVQCPAQHHLRRRVVHDAAAKVCASGGRYPVRSVVRGSTTIRGSRRAVGTGLHTSTVAPPATRNQPRMISHQNAGSSSLRVEVRSGG